MTEFSEEHELCILNLSGKCEEEKFVNCFGGWGMESGVAGKVAGRQKGKEASRQAGEQS